MKQNSRPLPESKNCTKSANGTNRNGAKKLINSTDKLEMEHVNARIRFFLFFFKILIHYGIERQIVFSKKKGKWLTQNSGLIFDLHHFCYGFLSTPHFIFL